MELDIAGRNVLVTGGASPLGQVICSELAAEGCAIGIWDEDGKAAEESLSQIAHSVRITSVTGPIANTHDDGRVCAAVQTALGDIDILIQCNPHRPAPKTCTALLHPSRGNIGQE